MASADVTRICSRVPSDKSESLSDEVLSLDSWSEKLDISTESQADFPFEYVDTHHRPPSLTAGNDRGGFDRLRHVSKEYSSSEVLVERSAKLRSEVPRLYPLVKDKKSTKDVSAADHVQDDFSSSLSSELELQSPRQAFLRQQPERLHSPSRMISQTQTHHFVYPPPVRPQSTAHRFVGTRHHSNSPSSAHFALSHRGSHPRSQASGVLNFRTFQQHHQRPNHPDASGVHTNGNQAPIDQIIEREGEKLKTKMKSIWNNVKYGWTLKTKTHFKYDSPIFLLGRCYHRRAEEGDQEQTEQQHHHHRYKVSAMDEFHADFTSRLWFTYRREFAPIGSAKMTTDCGWGCMLRSGQMMMAQAFVAHFLSRDWRVYSEQKPEDLAFYREIIRWFGDHPSDKVPFSVHRLVELGTSVGKMPGDWYGPASVAHIFSEAVAKSYKSLPKLSNICVYVAQDCTIYRKDLFSLVQSRPRTESVNSISPEIEARLPITTASTSNQFQQEESHHSLQQPETCQEEFWRSVVILIPMRLGGESMNDIYIPCVKSMLAHDNCIGIIGGRPKHSLYFVGWQDDKLIYLDPHYCQDVVDTSYTHFPIQSFHCMSPRKILMNKMDPSCTVGFYCRDKQDLLKFIDQVPDLVVPPRQKGQYPLFVVSDGCSKDTATQESVHREKGLLRVKHTMVDREGNRVRSQTLESEEFVIF